MNPKVQQGATIAVMLGIVVAVMTLAGYQVVLRPDAELTKTLTGGLILAFGMIMQRLFGANNPPPSP